MSILGCMSILGPSWYTPELAQHLARAFSKALSRRQRIEENEVKVSGLESVIINDVLSTGDWAVEHSWNWRCPSHINIFESYSLVSLFKKLVKQGGDRRFAALLDSRVAKGAHAKGRSSARSLRTSLQQACAYAVAGNLHPSYGFAPTRLNAADAPTRFRELPEPAKFSIIDLLSESQISVLHSHQFSRAAAGWIRLFILLALMTCPGDALGDFESGSSSALRDGRLSFPLWLLSLLAFPATELLGFGSEVAWLSYGSCSCHGCPGLDLFWTFVCDARPFGLLTLVGLCLFRGYLGFCPWLPLGLGSGLWIGYAVASRFVLTPLGLLLETPASLIGFFRGLLWILLCGACPFLGLPVCFFHCLWIGLLGWIAWTCLRRGFGLWICLVLAASLSSDAHNVLPCLSPQKINGIPGTPLKFPTLCDAMPIPAVSADDAKRAARRAGTVLHTDRVLKPRTRSYRDTLLDDFGIWLAEHFSLTIAVYV